MKYIYTIMIGLFVTAGLAAQDPPPLDVPGIEEAYLAKDDGNGKAGEQVTEFRTTDVPIYCVILLGADAKAVVKMNFVAVSVPGVKPETKVVTSTYTTKEGQNRVNFIGRPEDRWTPGKYRVDLFLNGKIERIVEFHIKGSGVNSNNSAVKYLQSPESLKSPVKRPAKN